MADDDDLPSKTELTALRRLWYSRLRDKGFEDIECLASDGNFYDLLKHPCRIDPTSKEYREQEEYYRQARAYCHLGTFESRKDREIWTLHSEGFSYRDITFMVRRVNVYRVNKTVKKYREEMKQHVVEEAQRNIVLSTSGEIEVRDDDEG